MMLGKTITIAIEPWTLHIIRRVDIKESPLIIDIACISKSILRVAEIDLYPIAIFRYFTYAPNQIDGIVTTPNLIRGRLRNTANRPSMQHA